MRKFLDLFSWWFLLLFAAPTVLIMGSWNSLPGEPMYGVKIRFERILLFFAKPSYTAEASLNVKYTQRRLTETTTLLSDKKSGEGLSYLSQQVVATKAVIDRAPNVETKKVLARQYVVALRNAASQLDQQKQGIVSTNPAAQPTHRIYPTATPIPPYQPTSDPNVPTATPMPTQEPVLSPTPALIQNPSDLVEAIDDTTTTINETIDDLEAVENEQDLSPGNSNQWRGDNQNGENGNGGHENGGNP